MKWARLEIKVPIESTEILKGFLIGKGIDKWEENGGLRIYMVLDETLSSFLAELQKFLLQNTLKENISWTISLSVLEEHKWESKWREAFTLRKVGEKLVIKPPWIEYEPKEEEIVLEIEPRSAFGTGEHPSTRLCLSLMEKFLKKDSIVLDVGCGSGILSLAAALLGAGKVIGIDIDEMAVRESEENASRLGLGDKVVFLHGNLLKDIPTTKADLILCNIDLPSLRAIFPYLTYYLKPGGIL